MGLVAEAFRQGLGFLDHSSLRSTFCPTLCAKVPGVVLGSYQMLCGIGYFSGYHEDSTELIPIACSVVQLRVSTELYLHCQWGLPQIFPLSICLIAQAQS